MTRAPNAVTEDTINDDPIQLFWTGGLDSTFRLLQILWEGSRPVQPIYIEDPNRPSLATENATRAKIRLAVLRDHPELAERFLEEKTYPRAEVVIHPEVRDGFRELASRFHVGGQYEFLAAFAREYAHGPIEVCFTWQPKTKKEALNAHIESLMQGTGHDCRIETDPPHPIFKDFRFPVIHVSKTEMGVIAKELGFESYLSETWYCSKPTPDGQACGLCNPCRIARADGVERNTRERSRTRLILNELRESGKRTIRRAQTRLRLR